MRAHNSLHGILLLTAAVMVLLPAGATAQRRPITPGVKQPVPEAEPEATREGAKKQPEKEEGAPAAVERASIPALAAQEDEEAVATRRPAGRAAPEPAAPRESAVLLPKDELESPRPTVTRPTAAPAHEAVYRKEISKHSVILRVRPAKPQPARSVELLFEVARLLEAPDPGFGNRQPLEGGIFLVTFSLDGRVESRHRLHPLRNAGTYGLHLTAPTPGVYRVELAQQLESTEIGDVALTTEFPLGFGLETPLQAATDGEARDAVQGRRGRRAVSSQDRDAPADLMVELGEHWMALRTALEGPQADADELAAHAQAIKELTAKLEGRSPAGAALEFGHLAAGLAPLSALPASFAQPSTALQLMDRTELAGCNRCHARFRFRLTDNVSKWPQFSPEIGR